jgi:hypothetical protein
MIFQVLWEVGLQVNAEETNCVLTSQDRSVQNCNVNVVNTSLKMWQNSDI